MRNNRACHKLTHLHSCIVAAWLFVTASPLAAATLRCPPRMPGPHPGFEQIGPVPSAHWLLWRMQLFDLPPNKGNPTGLLPAPATVRHDGVTLNWRPASADDVQIACLYNGSATTYQARLHPPPTACTLQNDGGLAQGWCETR